MLKTLLPHLADDPRMLEMFIKEARVASLVSGPNVVRMFEHGEHHGQHFLVLEYVDGLSLDRLLGRTPLLSATLVAYVAAQACAGLAAIHEQTGMAVVHRDISPSNLLISTAGVVKVSDFGIAKTYTTDPGGTTTVGATKGKIVYMSPEQAKGKNVDARTDLFALGDRDVRDAHRPGLPYAGDEERLRDARAGRVRPAQGARRALAADAPRAHGDRRAGAGARRRSCCGETRGRCAKRSSDFFASVTSVSPARELGERVKACVPHERYAAGARDGRRRAPAGSTARA